MPHVSILELIASLLQMAEKRLDAPPHLVEFQSLRAMESMADDRHESIASFADTLCGEMDLLAEDLVELCGVFLPSVPLAPPVCGNPADQ